MKKIKTFVKWCIRLLFWIFSGFGLLEKRIDFVGGWDTLHIFAPYSFGGLKRKDFFLLFNRSKKGEHLGIQTINLHTYNDLHNIPREVFLKVNDRIRLAYQYFLSPWKKNYNWN